MRTPSALLLSLLLAIPALAADAPKAAAKPESKPAVHKPLAEQPLRMAKDIEAFEAKDKANPPPQQALLLSGASSLRMWKNVDEALKPYPVINRGFGGSYTTEVLGYMDRITLPYHPRVVVFHCGGNDVNAGDPAEAPLGRIREYVKRLRKDNPHTAVVFMATTRAPSRKAKWPELDKFNAGLAALREVVRKHVARGAQVGVRVDDGGHHRLAGEVHVRGALRRVHLALASDRGDVVAVHHECAVLDRRRVVTGDETCALVDDHGRTSRHGCRLLGRGARGSATRTGSEGQSDERSDDTIERARAHAKSPP